MATKPKATTTVTPKAGSKPLTRKQVQNMIDKAINPVAERIDRIVYAISKAKKVKGL